MKATFADYIAENPSYKKYQNDPTAQGIFELLSQDESIIALIEAADRGQPALSACAAAVEEYGDSFTAPFFNVRSGFERTGVGCMVKTILAPFGYRPTENKKMPTSTSCRYFKSAHCYARSGPASMGVVKEIVEL